MSKEISKSKADFVNIPIDKETLEAIAAVECCNYNNFDWWEVSQYIKNLCLKELEQVNIQRDLRHALTGD